MELAGIFAVAVHAYAVMSNHFHVVVQIDPLAPWEWDDEEVARRWLALCGGAEESIETRIGSLTDSPERLAILRTRLGSLSWFMRCLKEPIARRANHEDGCSGRFWEGRFRTQALLDDSAVLACMAYVDLNPMRAGIARTLKRSRHTSAWRRIRARASRAQLLGPVAASITPCLPALREEQFIALLEWTADCLHGRSSDAEQRPAPPEIQQLALRPRQWLFQVPATESRYWRVIGRIETLSVKAKEAGLQWLRGMGTARAMNALGDTS